MHEVLKREWEVEAVSPGVADHITLGIAAGAGLVAAHMVEGTISKGRSRAVVGIAAPGSMSSY